MRIHEQTDSLLVLTGIPGRRVWMIVLTGFGLFLTGSLTFFAHLFYKEHGGLMWPHLALGIGLLIAQVILWTGIITLVFGRLTLILDTTLGTGEYRVRSPIVDAGRPCKFKLEHIDSIAIETSRENRPGRPNHVDAQAVVHRLRLRLTHPRRAITLDETENNRLARLEELATHVARFLGKTPLKVPYTAH
jgi:hypothetical protein